MKILKIILITVLVVVVGLAAFGYWSLRSGNLQKTVVTEVSNRVLKNQDEKNFLQTILGFDKPRTYLILFLNNTELRPGGGFIGAYALVQVDKGMPKILKVQGTEILDNLGKKDFDSVAPAPITKYLKVSRWYFRDSNWSPDFSISAQKSIELFLKQGGADSIDKIDAVVGFTPTVVEQILKIHGPITVNKQEFNAQNFTEKLEYEVEYGYYYHGLEFSERKSMLRDLAFGLMADMRFDIFKNWHAYYDLLQTMLKEKQIAMYAQDSSEQEIFAKKDWAGEMLANTGDYLLWADANLGALKTDAVITRQLSYDVVVSSTDKFVATAKMKFIHKGKFDWRTSRYRDYARVFVPLGSKLLESTGAMDMEKSTKPGVIDQGVENGRQWFGTFIAVEPGHTGELSFSYYLPENIVSQIKNESYELTVQKQIGTNDTALTLSLNFGKKIVSANPGESPDKYGDNRYDLTTDLKEDREFNVKLTN